MQKTAQKRGIINKILETANMPGHAVDSFFKPELQRIMGDLKKADDNIRSILTGQKIGDSDVATDGKAVKDLLKSAHSNFNRREYMSGIADLGMFHKKMYDVTKFLKGLNLSVEKIHHNFLFKDLKETDKWNSVEELQKHMSSLAHNIPKYFIKEAGIMDFFYNIGTKRGRGLAAWEKKYPKVVKDLRDDGLRLLAQADNVLANTLLLLKEMATARATRQVDDYMAAARKIELEYSKFDNGDKGFRAYYNNIVKPYLDRQADYDKAEKVNPQSDSIKVPDAKELEKQEVSTENSGPPTDRSPPPIMTSEPTTTNDPSQLSLFGPNNSVNVPPASQVVDLTNKLPAPAKVPNIVPTQNLVVPPSGASPSPTKTRESIEAQHGFEPMSGFAHAKFLNSLEKLSNEHPYILANYISKYATHILDQDPETAIKLFTIVKKLKG